MKSDVTDIILQPAITGVLHALIPIFYRMVMHGPEAHGIHTCKAPIDLDFRARVFEWVCGGRDWNHALVTPNPSL